MVVHVLACFSDSLQSVSWLVKKQACGSSETKDQCDLYMDCTYICRIKSNQAHDGVIGYLHIKYDSCVSCIQAHIDNTAII